MSKNVMLNVKNDFDCSIFAQKLSDTYRAKGYRVNSVEMNGMYMITLSKNDDGLNHWLGLGENLKITCMMNNGVLNLSLSEDGAWTNKIIVLAIGWMICCIPFITGIIGCMRQSSLSKDVENDATMIAASR